MSDDLVTVRIVGLPVAIHRRAAEHDDTLRRELALVRAGREADAGARLVALSDELESRFRGFTAAQTAQLAAADADGVIDLVYELPPDAADAADRLGALLDEVDELCRVGELVTVCAPPELVVYRRWLLDEFVGQIREGREPRPWAGGLPALFVEGDLDLFGAPTLRAAIAERLEAGISTMVIDLSACGFIDSVGLSLLLTTRERCRAAGGGLWVVNAGESALRLFETVGVRELLVRQ